MWDSAAAYLRGRMQAERGLQRRVAGLADVPETTLYRWTIGRQIPDVDSASRIAAALGMTLGQLMGEEPRPAPVEWEASVEAACRSLEESQARLRELLARRSPAPVGGA